MSTFYLEILANHSPFQYGVDGNNRVLFSCNYRVKARYPVVNLIKDIKTILVSEGLNEPDIFLGPLAIVRPVNIFATGGMPPEETHNGDKYERPTFQVVTRSEDYTVAEGLSRTIYNKLDGRRNVTV